MSNRPFLGLVALGPVDPEILRRLRIAIANFYLLPVRVLSPKPLPPNTFDAVRSQHHSTQLLEYLLAEDSSGAFRILGVTASDLYIPIFTFVFGEAQLDGKAAIISMFRPRGGTDRPPPLKSVLLKRLVKLGLHELGHTFGLGHCREDACLMGFSSNLEDLDQRNLTFCKYCQVLLADYYRDNGLTPDARRHEETTAPGAPAPVADSGHKRRR